MQKSFLLLLCLLAAALLPAQEKTNQVDAQQHRQGRWTEEVEGVRGEPGFTWEGTYRNGRKEGIWKKYSSTSTLLAEETFRNNVLDGHCRYFYPNGRLNAEGSYIAVEIEGQRDTIIVIDPVSGAETPTEVVRKGNSVRQGLWKLYDEEGHMIKEYYNRGEPAAPDAADTLQQATRDTARKTSAPALPHQQTRPANRKKQ